jgi:hypothetical protein
MVGRYMIPIAKSVNLQLIFNLARKYRMNLVKAKGVLRRTSISKYLLIAPANATVGGNGVHDENGFPTHSYEAYSCSARNDPTTSALQAPHRANPYSMSLRSLSPVLCHQNGGFALIIVLWTLVLIALIVVQTTAGGRTEIRIASNLITNAVAQAAADGAIYEAIFILSNPQPDQRWPVDGSKRELVVGYTRVTVQLEDEAWWINPNWASPALLEALLRATGTDPETARHLADAVSEWVGSAPAPRAPIVILADYRAAGLD